MLFEFLDGGQNLCNSHKDKLPHFTSSIDKEGDSLLLNLIALSPVAREYGAVDRRYTKNSISEAGPVRV